MLLWFVAQVPLLQVWFAVQVFCNCWLVEFEQYEVAVPGLLQVYVM